VASSDGDIFVGRAIIRRVTAAFGQFIRDEWCVLIVVVKWRFLSGE
jgi:hypothetical protein